MCGFVPYGLLETPQAHTFTCREQDDQSAWGENRKEETINNCTQIIIFSDIIAYFLIGQINTELF